MIVKKIFAVILLCVLCASGCAKEPEEFAIRNGIKFGMTPEEVIAIEGEENKTDETIFSDGGAIIYYKDVMMGADTEITYSFDNGGLDFILYDIDDKYFQSSCEANYNSINETLREKYGKEAVNVIEIDKNNGTEDWITIWSVPQKDKDVEILHMAIKDAYGYFWAHTIRYINSGAEQLGMGYLIKDYQLDANKL